MWLLLLVLPASTAVGQSLFEQRQLLYSTNSDPKHGLNWSAQPPATVPEIVGATPGQFRGAVVFGGVTRQANTNDLVPGSFAVNAVNIDWPRSMQQGVVTSLLRAAVGVPYLANGFDFLFGQKVTPPLTDLAGVKLAADITNYWHTEPVTIQVVTNATSPVTYSTNLDGTHSGEPYYWSPHAGAAYATKPGQMHVVWRRLESDGTTLPAGGTEWVTHVRVGSFYYAIKDTVVLVSGIPVQEPQSIYWTKGDFEKTGKPVLVPTGVKEVNFVYNDSIPQVVPEAEVVIGGNIVPNTGEGGFNNGNTQINTATIKVEAGFITAYNREGRIFVELLGDATGASTKRQLGIEIVDVIREPVPADVTIELGERVSAYPDNAPSDASLQPSPITQIGASFAYQHSVSAGGLELYAVRETRQLTDYQVIWTRAGVGGLQWPYRFSRYSFIWSADPSKYSHYIRPEVPDENAAKLTAITLPGENAAKLDYQDPSYNPNNNNAPRAVLTDGSRFYTFLDTNQPTLRALLRYNVGNHVAFERVFSWLVGNLRTTNFASTGATNLTAWNGSSFDWATELAAPRLVSETAYVGDRLVAPADELGATGDYFAGYINQDRGISFNAAAYKDPFLSGFEAANQGAIIPVNAIPGKNRLEVWWFRKNLPTELRDESLGFQPTYWPAVVGQYTLAYPDANHPRYREIVLASNHGSGPLSSFETGGSLYLGNTTPETVGYNPNEEHALLQGGRAWALRDDLNVTNGINFSSEPYVLLDFKDADGRPNMSAFHVVRESATDRFDYAIEAGTILQPPMPLPLMDKPLPPTAPGRLPHSINAEVARRTVVGITFPASDSGQAAVALDDKPLFVPYQTLVLQSVVGAGRFSLLVTNVDHDLDLVNGVISTNATFRLSEASGANQPTATNRYVYAVDDSSGIAIGADVLVINPQAGKVLFGDVYAVTDAFGSDPATVTLEFGTYDVQADADLTAATELVLSPLTSQELDALVPAGFASGWQLAYETLSEVAAGASQEAADRAAFYNQFTFQDRKGSLWVYRGPHTARDRAARKMQFYYKTLPGFWFPTDQNGEVLGTTGLRDQPPVGTITPYLRVSRNGGGFIGDAVYGNRLAREDEHGLPKGDGNALGVTYRARWPESTPVLQMAETLTVPKRGLPAVRGQTSMEILYQQSAYSDSTNASVVLHDPTAAKKFPLFDTKPDDSADGLNKLPASIQTSVYRGKTYFPRLAPHLVDRFYFDPADTKNGSLVFIGEFRNEVLGESYVLPNFLSSNDIAALKALCAADDPKKSDWDQAIDDSGSGGLSLDLETFYPNPAKPGTFTSTIEVGGQSVHQAERFHAPDLVQVRHSDSAVDSYALTAVGPGTGYVTLIAGQGAAFTPPDEPVAVKIVRVVDTLYRGEVKVILSSNPLGEKVTMQQVVDLAGKVEQYDFEWWIAAPVDGAPPPVYGNTPVNLMFSGSPDPWHHLRHPLLTDSPASLGAGGSATAGARLVSDVSSRVVPISTVPFSEVATDDYHLRFVVTAETAARLVSGNQLLVRDLSGNEVPAAVASISSAGTPPVTTLIVDPTTGTVLPEAANVSQLYERVMAHQPQSVIYRDFSVADGNSYSQYYLSLDLDAALGANVYVDGELAVVVNRGEDDTASTSAPSGFAPAPLAKVYALGPQTFAGGTKSGGQILHRISVELFSEAVPGATVRFNCQLDAYQSVDLVDAPGSQWLKLDAAKAPDKVRTIIGESADVRALSDNYVISRYRANNPAHASFRSDVAGVKQGWSQWTEPALAEGWIKRVLAGINPFNQRTSDLFNNTVNTDANILTSAGRRWEGDVALNLDSINDYGLIEIYETVLRRGKDLSINAGISYDPANDALLLAAGYLSDLYMLIGNEARSDAANPTIGIGTKDQTYGDVATALFAFKGQLPSLLEEELALLRGRDDFLQPGVRLPPVYNRLVWNYTRGIDAGEVIYALNYNILDQNTDGRVDAADASVLYPQGHGDAYGHYLTALTGYYSLLIDKDFAWVPRIEAVNILGKPVAVDYQDERKFAAAAAAVARTGRQVFDLTWRKDYQPGNDVGWEHFSSGRENTGQPIPTRREWGLDHWAARTGEGAYLNWAVGNSILPAVDPNPAHEGIQKVDRTTVPELRELATTGRELQSAMDNAEGRLTPLGLAEGSLAFDLNPNQVTGTNPKAHFEQVYERALVALNNSVASFDDAKDVTRLMRSEQDSLAELQASVEQQELAYESQLIELYGTPYPDDVGPGKLYKQGYEGPDLFHYNYVETESIEAPGIYTPNEPDYVAKIDIQQLNANWSYIDNPPKLDVSTNGPVDGSSSDLVIINLNDPKYEEIDPITGKKLYYIPYAFGSHGFFDKPKNWTSQRRSPGKIQQAISELIQAHDRMYYALAAQCESDKQDLDKAVQVFKQKVSTFGEIKGLEESTEFTQNGINASQHAYNIANKWLEVGVTAVDDAKELFSAAIPDSLIFGVAGGGDTVQPFALGLTLGILEAVKATLVIGDAIAFTAVEVGTGVAEGQLLDYANQITDLERKQELREAVFDLGNQLKAVQGDFQVINEKLRILDDTKRRYAALVAEGDRLLQERQIFRQRSAAIVQGFRTRDAAFRIFRNEKLERYKALFDLSARYAYLAANAYDYDTGLLNTAKGREFVARIVNSRALGVVKDGEPQFAGSNLGDPGLSSVLAEMRADWEVVKGRLGFNNPTAYGTTFSLRTEQHRILPTEDGRNAWKDVLLASRKANILEDADVKRFCMQVDPGNGLPIPGLVVEFETTIADGYNFFGQTQQAWDHYFDSSSFATKIFGAGVAFEGYIGMDNPVANSGAVGGAGGSSAGDPNLAFLDPLALGATPGIYLVPVGLDSMRSPALGDAGNVRTWSVEDVTIPLPFNVGGSDFSNKPLYQTGESLSEPLFGIRKHASFRPVSTTAAFSSAIYGNNGSLQRSQFTNTRLIGRSVWNSKWKLVIPGTKLLHDPDEGLRRFIESVTDIKLHLVTYSYAGN